MRSRKQYVPYETQTVAAAVTREAPESECLLSQFRCVNDSNRDNIISLVKEFRDVFSWSKYDIGLARNAEHKIELKDNGPIQEQTRRIPVALQEKVDEFVEQLLQKNIIQPSLSEWNAPIVIVPKKDGDIRLTVDYRRLNQKTKVPSFPIPDAQQLFDTLGGAKHFSTIDLAAGYYNISLAECDREKTAFSTRKGHWEFLRLPMGLAAAPATFQRVMKAILKEEDWRECLIYLDDILVFGKTREEHLVRLRKVLSKIKEAGLKIAPAKCQFFARDVKYLGHRVSSNGISMDEDKIKCIQEWPQPESQEEMRKFLGLCGYYRNYIKEYAKIVAPLEEACKDCWNKARTRKLHPLQWSACLGDAFLHLKQCLMTAPILAVPNSYDQFILDTDACDNTIGCVLSQVQSGDEKVIAYASHKLSTAEQHYCVTRKELLSVYKYTKMFRHYLFGRRFSIRTDHKALCWMMNRKTPSTSQFSSWLNELSVFDMDIQYRKGEEHTNADALSRAPEQCQQCAMNHENPKAKRNVKYYNENQNDKKTVVYCRRIAMEEEICQTDDNNLALIIKLMKKKNVEDQYPGELQNAEREAQVLWRNRKDLRFRGDLLYIIRQGDYKLLLPKNRRDEIIGHAHMLHGHIGVSKTTALLKEKFYWPGMSFDVRIRIGKCKECQSRKNQRPDRNKAHGSLNAGYPFGTISIDVTGPLPESKNGCRYILGIIDNFSKYPMLIPLKNMTAKTICKSIFDKWIVQFGIPDRIHSDRGTAFESEIVQELCALLGIRKSRSSPYYPQGDGVIERLFGTAKDMLYATAKSSGCEWEEAIPFVEFGLRNTICRSTGFSPFEVIFGRKMRSFYSEKKVSPANDGNYCKYITELQQVLQVVSQQIKTKQEIKKPATSGSGVCLAIGDLVLARILPRIKGIDMPRYEGPYAVIGKLGKHAYRLKRISDGRIIERNVVDIKRLRTPQNDTRKSEEATTIMSKSIKNDHHDVQEEGQMPEEERLKINETRVRRNPVRDRQKPKRYRN